MAFPNGFPGTSPLNQAAIHNLLNVSGVGLAPVQNIRVAAAAAGFIPHVHVAGYSEMDRRNLEAAQAHTLELARLQEREATERRMMMMLDNHNRAQLQGPDIHLHNEPAPPGLESPTDIGGSFNERGKRDRQKDREGRNRDRDRSRDRDKRRHDGDRDRWGDEDVGRDRGRHDRHGRERNNRDRSPLRSERQEDDYSLGDRNYEDDSRYRKDREDGDKWVSQQPSRTIILRSLNQDVDSKMIGAELMVLGIPVKDIRLIRRASGVSRGFAFVEFHNADDAKRWMDHTQGTVVIQNQYKAFMDYSVGKERQGARDLQRNDWVCFKCMAHNFKRRDYCYNCNIPRKESEKNKSSDGEEEVGTNPCNTLIFRGLDALSTEESLVTALNQALPNSLAPIKNIAIIRDDLNTSRGFGFVEFHSVGASNQMLDYLSHMDPLLEVDGKQLMVNYARNTFNTTMSTIQQQASSQYYDNNYYQQQQGSQYYDPNTQQYYDYSQYYSQNTTAPHTSSASNYTTAASTKENTTNTAAAVAHAAIQQAQAHKNYKPISMSSLQQKSETVTVNGIEYPIYPPPDTSTYQYEETSGYYYDPMTQLYYDANSQYYYNSTTSSYMYWDAEKSTYLPAPGGDGSASNDDKKKDGKDKKDKEKVKMAKKIAKDMEKWAKSMNSHKDPFKDGGMKKFASPGAGPSGAFESAAADAGFAMFSKVKEDKSLMPPPPMMGGSSQAAAAAPSSKPGLVASYGGDSDSGEEEEPAQVDESKLVDWAKLACLLCKRQFQSKEILNKHTQFSDLHKQNLEQLNASKGAGSAKQIEYRDRAKERRKKYGAPEPPEPKKRKGRDYDNGGDTATPVPYEQPTKMGLGGDNIGNKMLQKMGWSSGQGLGKANQGRTAPIAAERRNASAGLGVRGGKVVAEAGDDYRVALKKTMFARYNELD